jgi:hypothetical protein
VGFDNVILTYFLGQHGFCDIERTGSFNLFNDTSEAVYMGRKISLNLVSKRCRVEGVDDDLNIEIDHNASPYVT